MKPNYFKKLEDYSNKLNNDLQKLIIETKKIKESDDSDLQFCEFLERFSVANVETLNIRKHYINRVDYFFTFELEGHLFILVTYNFEYNIDASIKSGLYYSIQNIDINNIIDAINYDDVFERLIPVYQKQGICNTNLKMFKKMCKLFGKISYIYSEIEFYQTNMFK